MRIYISLKKCEHPQLLSFPLVIVETLQDAGGFEPFGLYLIFFVKKLDLYVI